MTGHLVFQTRVTFDPFPGVSRLLSLMYPQVEIIDKNKKVNLGWEDYRY